MKLGNHDIVDKIMSYYPKWNDSDEIMKSNRSLLIQIAVYLRVFDYVDINR